MLHALMAAQPDKPEKRGAQIEGEMVLKGKLQGKLDPLDNRERDGLLLADKTGCCLAGKALCKFSLAANCLHKSQRCCSSILIMLLFHYSHCQSTFIFKSDSSGAALHGKFNSTKQHIYSYGQSDPLMQMLNWTLLDFV